LRIHRLLSVGGFLMNQQFLHQTMNRAVGHHQAGRLAEAEALYRQVLLQAPNHPDVLHLLGTILSQMGKPEEGLEKLRRAVALNPHSADYHSNLGIALGLLNRQEEAAAAFKRALQLAPGHANAGNNLGYALKSQNQFEEAIEVLRKTVAAHPKHAAAWHNLGDCLRLSGQNPEAADVFRREIALTPENPEPYNFLGVTLQIMDQTDEAIENFHRALAIKPEYADVYNNLGNALMLQGKMKEAIEACRKAIELQAEFPSAFSNMGTLLRDCDRPEEAIASYREAIRLKPDFVSAHDNLLFSLHCDARVSAEELFEEHLAWSRTHAAALAGEAKPHRNDRSPDRVLRIGYVSPDFRQHSVAFFFEGLLANHDPKQVETFCYADLNRADPVTMRLQETANHFHVATGISDAQLAQRIRSDRIDILVDLAGHTADNRMLTFARKPAPIQVTYLGYPNTTGLAAMDYRLTDAWADPVGMTEKFNTEELVRLPDCFICYRPPEVSPLPAPPPSVASGAITFGSFNNLPKYTQTTVELWAEILKKIPSSRLLLKSQGLSDDFARQNVADRFTACGIGPDRLELVAKVRSLAGHLAVYERIDIALDPTPYNGTTTTCEAMWMGVPVVTLAGRAHAGRVGVSLLNNVGLPDLVARTREEYVQKAVDLAKNQGELVELRRTLRDRLVKSPIMDAPKFARNVEAAYRKMWRKWCAGA
jgi:predicted O-linked N-acetylglucosamine transferase (SPINDLY family)